MYLDTDEKTIDDTRSPNGRPDGCLKDTDANIENVRRRLARDFERQRALDREAVLRSFLSVADNLERAVKTGGGGKNPWHEGMKAIHRQLVDTLKAHDVIAFDPRGNRFDPALHEAAGVVSSPGNTSSGAVASGENGPVNKDRDGAEADGLVAEVILTGYTIGEGERRRVLRPAKVTVFKKRG